MSIFFLKKGPGEGTFFLFLIFFSLMKGRMTRRRRKFRRKQDKIYILRHHPSSNPGEQKKWQVIIDAWRERNFFYALKGPQSLEYQRRYKSKVWKMAPEGSIVAAWCPWTQLCFFKQLCSKEWMNHAWCLCQSVSSVEGLDPWFLPGNQSSWKRKPNLKKKESNLLLL